MASHPHPFDWDYMKIDFIERCVAILAVIFLVCTAIIHDAWGFDWPFFLCMGIVLLMLSFVARLFLQLEREMYGKRPN